MAQQGPLRVLVVDDNDDHRFLAKRALRDMAAAGELVLETASGGNEALARLAEEPMPHLVLLDIKMPGLDGFEVLARLRAGQPTRRLSVVMLSSSENAADIARARELGADDYVTKPLDPRGFAHAIQDVVRRWGERARQRAAHA